MVSASCVDQNFLFTGEPLKDIVGAFSNAQINVSFLVSAVAAWSQKHRFLLRFHWLVMLLVRFLGHLGWFWWAETNEVLDMTSTLRSLNLIWKNLACNYSTVTINTSRISQEISPIRDYQNGLYCPATFAHSRNLLRSAGFTPGLARRIKIIKETSGYQ